MGLVTLHQPVAPARVFDIANEARPYCRCGAEFPCWRVGLVWSLSALPRLRFGFVILVPKV